MCNEEILFSELRAHFLWCNKDILDCELEDRTLDRWLSTEDPITADNSSTSTTVVAESLSSTDQVDTTFGTQANNVVSQVLTDQVDLSVSTQVNDSVDAVLHQSPNLIDQTEVIVGVEVNQLDAPPNVTDIDANTPPALMKRLPRLLNIVEKMDSVMMLSKYCVHYRQDWLLVVI